MNKRNAYELLIKEYLSKCECCDECIASTYCTLNNLRSSRIPENGCEEKLVQYLKQR